MGRSITIEVTFVGIDAPPAGSSGADGVVRCADGTLHPFSGWIELLATLERLAGPTATTQEER